MKYSEIVSGTVFGKLTVVRPVEKFDSQGRRIGTSECICACGTVVQVLNSSLRNGNTKSCGCSRIESIRKRCMTHGDGNRNCRLWRIWSAMKQRCYRPRYQHFKDYGGRGIIVCDEWLHDYSAFKEWACANGYDDTKSIDRINPDLNYDPSNCRWATVAEQQRNKRTNKKISVNGISLCVSEWAMRLGVSASSLYQFAHRGGNLEKRIKELKETRC